MTKNTSQGHTYKEAVGHYIAKTFGHRGVLVYTEVPLGYTVIGKRRKMDLLVIEQQTGRVLAIECKSQDTQGTADEKIPYTLADLQSLGRSLPAIVVYRGEAWSKGIEHMLESSPIAVRCDPPTDMDELDATLALTFHWWDLVLEGKEPLKP